MKLLHPRNKRTRGATDPARLAAWRALSELFLDTELDDGEIAVIARELRSTGFSVAELERIYEEEVAPACWCNLLAVPGGVWTGFNERWLVETIPQYQQRSRFLDALPFLRRLRIRRWTRLSRTDWERVKHLLAR